MTQYKNAGSMYGRCSSPTNGKSVFLGVSSWGGRGGRAVEYVSNSIRIQTAQQRYQILERP